MVSHFNDKSITENSDCLVYVHGEYTHKNDVIVTNFLARTAKHFLAGVRTLCLTGVKNLTEPKQAEMLFAKKMLKNSNSIKRKSSKVQSFCLDITLFSHDYFWLMRSSMELFKDAVTIPLLPSTPENNPDSNNNNLKTRLQCHLASHC